MKKIAKISRGYRLIPSTHKLISEIQKIMEIDSNTALTRACRMYMKHIKNNKNISVKTLKNNSHETD